MTTNICFFHRNQFHNQLYPKIGKIMREEHGFNVFHLRRVGEIKNEVVFEYEKIIEKLWNDLDISFEELNNLKKKYPDSDLMRIIYAERNYNFFPKYNYQKPVPYETQLKYLIGCFKVFEDYVCENDIQSVVSDLATGIPDVLRLVCQKNNIKYITIRSSKLIKGFIFCDGISEKPIGLSDKYKDFRNNKIPKKIQEQAKQHLDTIKANIKPPSYMEVTKNEYKLLSFERVRTLFNKIIKKNKRITNVSMDKRPFYTSILWNLNRKINIWGVKINKKKWFTDSINSNEKFFIFPLQYEPENSTAIRSYPFSNQICVIENIAKALPLGVFLYVKEHMGNQGYRKINDYRQLSYLPNVKLIPRESPVSDLLKRSIGVITLSSRMGWEGLLLGKSVIILGDTFYSDYEKLYRPSSWVELRKDILQCVQDSSEDKSLYDEERLLAYAAAYISLVFDGNYIFKSSNVLSDKNVRQLVSKIIFQIKGIS